MDRRSGIVSTRRAAREGANAASKRVRCELLARGSLAVAVCCFMSWTAEQGWHAMGLDVIRVALRGWRWQKGLSVPGSNPTAPQVLPRALFRPEIAKDSNGKTLILLVLLGAQDRNRTSDPVIFSAGRRVAPNWL
jgi:hypothetical protein